MARFEGKGGKTLSIDDLRRALKLRKDEPMSVEVKRRGSDKWIRYQMCDVHRVNWDQMDAARLRYPSMWRNEKPVDEVAQIVRIYPR